MSQTDIPPGTELVSRPQMIARQMGNSIAIAWFDTSINSDPDDVLRYNYIAAVWSLASQAIFTAYLRSRISLQEFVDYDDTGDIRDCLLANGYHQETVEQVCVAKREARGEGYA